MTSSPASIRKTWGARSFATASPGELDRLPLVAEDREILSTVGLPTAPKETLRIEQEWQRVEISHFDDGVCLLTETRFKKPKRFPKLGQPEFDQRHELTNFVTFGRLTATEGLGRGNVAHLCIAGRKRHIYAIDSTPTKGVTGSIRLNTNLSRYLACLLAYKQWIEKIETMLSKVSDVDDLPASRVKQHLDNLEAGLKAAGLRS